VVIFCGLFPIIGYDLLVCIIITNTIIENIWTIIDFFVEKSLFFGKNPLSLHTRMKVLLFEK